MMWILCALGMFMPGGYAEPVRLGSARVVHLREHVSYLHDVGGELGLAEVRTKAFTPGFKGGFFEGAVWLRAEICPDGARALHLVYKDPIPRFDVFTPDARGDYVAVYGGLDRSQEDFWTRVSLALTDCGQVYLRLSSADVLNANLMLMDDGAYHSMELGNIALYSFSYAVMIAVLAAVLLLFSRTSRPVFLLFAGIVVLQDAFGTALVNGFLFRYVLDARAFSRFDLGNLFVLLYNASVLWFVLAFCQVRNRALRTATYALIATQLACLVPLLVNLIWTSHQPSATLSWLVNRSFMFTGGWLLMLAALAARQRDGYVFAGMIVAKVSAILIKALALQGDLPELQGAWIYNLVLYNAMAFGSMAEAIGVISLLILSYADEVRAKARRLDRAEADARMVDVCRQVAHDIRSPLGALRIGARLAAVPPEHRALLDAASTRIEEIAEGLLNMSLDVVPGPVELLAVLEEIIREKQVLRPDLRLAAALNARPVVWIAAAELKRALSNLIENAAEAVDAGGEVSVRLDVVAADARIVIADNGPGMDGQTLARVGAKGFSTKTSGGSGSGLGVYHARKTAEAAGGQLMITSELGRGTEVQILLPVRGQAPAHLLAEL